MFKLFWYKVFVHLKLKLLNFLMDSVLISQLSNFCASKHGKRDIFRGCSLFLLLLRNFKSFHRWTWCPKESVSKVEQTLQESVKTKNMSILSPFDNTMYYLFLELLGALKLWFCTYLHKATRYRTCENNFNLWKDIWQTKNLNAYIYFE